MKVKLFSLAAVMLVLAGCAQVMSVLQSVNVQAPLTEQEVISGLKEALTTGARNSAERLATENGYYGDMAVKIFLPDEAKIIVDNISRIPGGDKLVEDVIRQGVTLLPVIREIVE